MCGLSVTRCMSNIFLGPTVRGGREPPDRPIAGVIGLAAEYAAMVAQGQLSPC